MKYYFTIFLLTISLFSCTKEIYLNRINSYLNASTTESKSKYLSNGYRSFFIEKKGEGKDKTSALRSFLEWDAPLHPDVIILHYTINDDTWTVEFNEQNDFSKLIGFPGWKGKEIFRFTKQKLIEEVIYIPDPGNLSYKKWLQPAIDWLQKNKPDDLDEVYKNGKLVQTPETAKKWVSLLQLWQKETALK